MRGSARSTEGPLLFTPTGGVATPLSCLAGFLGGLSSRSSRGLLSWGGLAWILAKKQLPDANSQELGGG